MRAGLVCATLLLVVTPVWAHEVHHTIERGKAVAVKAYYADGEPLAYAEYQVFSPGDPKLPQQKGRTDRAGYAAFVPDAPGTWRVKIADATGHGVEVVVPVDAAGRATEGPAAGPSAWGFVARPAFGVLLIAGLFALLVLLYRRKAAR
jgi:nickel transport protein